MAFQPAPDIAKVAVVTSNGVSNYVNTFHFRREGLWGLTELDALLEGVATAWVNDIMVFISYNIVLLRVEGRGLRAENDVSSEYVLPQPVAGTVQYEPLPGNVAFAVTHLTGLTGRYNRGRTFFVGLPETAVTGDFVVTGTAVGLRNGLEGIRVYTSSLGWQMAVLSRYYNKAPRPIATATPIIGFRFRDRIVDSQRRRLTGRGS